MASNIPIFVLDIPYIPYKPPCLQVEYFLKKKRDGNIQEKAPNPFMVFRACIVAELKELNIKTSGATEVSSLASYHWKMLPEDQKEPYKEITSELKKIQQELHQAESYINPSHHDNLHGEWYQNTSNHQDLHQNNLHGEWDHNTFNNQEFQQDGGMVSNQF
ncbi:4467_t:CDS:1 [Ambispora gerdemannii]|uniref:4467_t:CDS:1 n=1 Tax=Ambispora gerdemannii TaxID=144530 RepID=A0A9N8VXQ0_9GLOM|nr:4467_t:CDS:1 [Ambispora gerdemannii]